MAKNRYQELAAMVGARINCLASNNDQWFEEWSSRIEQMINDGPSGSGIDSGTQIDLEKSNAEKIILYSSYHHMNDGGMYDGWTEHTLTVTPSLQFGFNLKISGRNRNDIKEYLHEVYFFWLDEDVPETLPSEEPI